MVVKYPKAIPDHWKNTCQSQLLERCGSASVNSLVGELAQINILKKVFSRVHFRNRFISSHIN